METAPDSNKAPCYHQPLYNQLTEARANEKRLTIVDPRQQCYAMSKIPSVCILESPCLYLHI